MSEPMIAAARTIAARGIVEGEGEGLILVSPPISFLGDVDIRSGTIVGDLVGVRGLSVKGRVLVMPYTRGSAGAWRFLYQLAKLGTHPAAIVTDELPDPSSVQGAILGKIPMVCAPAVPTSDLAAMGDWARVVSRDGTATIRLGAPAP